MKKRIIFFFLIILVFMACIACSPKADNLSEAQMSNVPQTMPDGQIRATVSGYDTLNSLIFIKLTPVDSSQIESMPAAANITYTNTNGEKIGSIDELIAQLKNNQNPCIIEIKDGTVTNITIT